MTFKEQFAEIKRLYDSGEIDELQYGNCVFALCQTAWRTAKDETYSIEDAMSAYHNATGFEIVITSRNTVRSYGIKGV